MSRNKTENDWFLRGGKRPEQEPDTVTVKVTVCQNCGGHNLPDDTECTHCGASLTGEPSTEEYCGCDYSSCPECGAKLENPDDIDACVCPACGWEPSIVHDGSGNPHDTGPCAECDGLTRCDDCPHNQDLLNNEDDDETDDDEREFTVVMSRFRTVKQEARVVVKADCEESAMEKAEELAEDYGDVWNWEDVEGSEDIEDVGAEEAEEP